jgi:hypothetical protein
MNTEIFLYPPFAARFRRLARFWAHIGAPLISNAITFEFEVKLSMNKTGVHLIIAE